MSTLRNHKLSFLTYALACLFLWGPLCFFYLGTSLAAILIGYMVGALFLFIYWTRWDRRHTNTVSTQTVHDNPPRTVEWLSAMAELNELDDETGYTDAVYYLHRRTKDGQCQCAQCERSLTVLRKACTTKWQELHNIETQFLDHDDLRRDAAYREMIRRHYGYKLAEQPYIYRIHLEHKPYFERMTGGELEAWLDEWPVKLIEATTERNERRAKVLARMDKHLEVHNRDEMYDYITTVRRDYYTLGLHEAGNAWTAWARQYVDDHERMKAAVQGAIANDKGNVYSWDQWDEHVRL